MAYRLAAIFAHPDDDTFGIGGTLALAGRDVESTIVVVTNGEAGQISDPSLATRDNLGGVRQREERDALTALGALSAVHFLGYVDGAVDRVATDEVVGKLVPLLDAARPDVVVTFGPEGVTNHADHVAVHHAATRAFHLVRRSSGGTYPQRLLYSVIPQSEIDWFWDRLRERGEDVGDPEGPFKPRGVPDETIAVRVDCRPVYETKLRALKAHRTQSLDLDSIPEDLRPRVFGYEYFVQAWPPWSPGAAPAATVFDGLAATS